MPCSNLLATTLCAATLAATASAQVNITSFNWSSSASTTASATGSCTSGCDPLQACTENPVPSYAAQGSSFGAGLVELVAGKSCSFTCGGNGLVASEANVATTMNVGLLLVAGDTVGFSFSHAINAAAGGGGVPNACGSGASSASVDVDHGWHLGFQTLGPTLVRMNYAQSATYAGFAGSVESRWSIRTPPNVWYFDESVGPTAPGTQTANGTFDVVLPQGTYTMELNAAITIAAGASSQGGGHQTSAIGDISFRPYDCVHVVDQPDDAVICPAGEASFQIAAEGESVDVAYQWQIESSSPGYWNNLTDGQLVLSWDDFPHLVADIAFANTPQLKVTLLPDGASWVPPRFRCYVTDRCGTVISQPATLTVATGDDPACRGCPVCPADYDQNGGVDGGDLGAFIADFEAGETCADVDSNGGVDGGDLGYFFTVFEQGGC